MNESAPNNSSAKTLGQVSYEAFAEAAARHNAYGGRLPRWETLSESESGRETRRHWDAAALGRSQEERNV